MARNPRGIAKSGHRIRKQGTFAPGKASHGTCPVCNLKVVQGTEHRLNGKRRWYHGWCWRNRPGS